MYELHKTQTEICMNYTRPKWREVWTTQDPNGVTLDANRDKYELHKTQTEIAMNYKT